MNVQDKHIVELREGLTLFDKRVIERQLADLMRQKAEVEPQAQQLDWVDRALFMRSIPKREEEIALALSVLSPHVSKLAGDETRRYEELLRGIRDAKMAHQNASHKVVVLKKQEVKPRRIPSGYFETGTEFVERLSQLTKEKESLLREKRALEREVASLTPAYRKGMSTRDLVDLERVFQEMLGMRAQVTQVQSRRQWCEQELNERQGSRSSVDIPSTNKAITLLYRWLHSRPALFNKTPIKEVESQYVSTFPDKLPTEWSVDAVRALATELERRKLSLLLEDMKLDQLKSDIQELKVKESELDARMRTTETKWVELTGGGFRQEVVNLYSIGVRVRMRLEKESVLARVEDRYTHVEKEIARTKGELDSLCTSLGLNSTRDFRAVLPMLSDFKEQLESERSTNEQLDMYRERAAIAKDELDQLLSEKRSLLSRIGCYEETPSSEVVEMLQELSSQVPRYRAMRLEQQELRTFSQESADILRDNAPELLRLDEATLRTLRFEVLRARELLLGIQERIEDLSLSLGTISQQEIGILGEGRSETPTLVASIFGPQAVPSMQHAKDVGFRTTEIFNYLCGGAFRAQFSHLVKQEYLFNTYKSVNGEFKECSFDNLPVIAQYQLGIALQVAQLPKGQRAGILRFREYEGGLRYLDEVIQALESLTKLDYQVQYTVSDIHAFIPRRPIAESIEVEHLSLDKPTHLDTEISDSTPIETRKE